MAQRRRGEGGVCERVREESKQQTKRKYSATNKKKEKKNNFFLSGVNLNGFFNRKVSTFFP